eukprot:UN01999
MNGKVLSLFTKNNLYNDIGLKNLEMRKYVWAQLNILRGCFHSDSIVCAQRNSDGKDLLVTASLDQSVRYWTFDPKEKMLNSTLKLQLDFTPINICSHGDHLVICTRENDNYVLHVWNKEEKKGSIVTDHEEEIVSISINDNQKDNIILLTGSNKGELKLWDLKGLKKIDNLKSHRAGINGIIFIKDQLITGSTDKFKQLRFWS